MGRAIRNLFNKMKYEQSIIAEVSSINLHRIQVLGGVMGLINVIHILIFWLNTPNRTTDMLQWHYLVITIHAWMLVINGSLAGFAAFIVKRNKKTSKLSFSLQMLSILCNLLFGIFLCVSDQLVTTNINPLLIACIGVGVSFLVPPIIAVGLYSFTFFLFYYLVSLTQHSPQLLELIRINSVTATIMGLGISWVLWRNNLLRLEQKKLIEEQQRKLEEKNAHLQFLAKQDPLTGLYNRAGFIELVEKELYRMSRTYKEASIILLDIDFFKSINDNFGHPAGDKILLDTSEIIVNSLRRSDISARLGGEEFIILLPETTLQASVEVAEKLRQNIENHDFIFEGETLNITASFGVSRLEDSFTQSYHEADKVLYSAKNNGKNRVSFADVS